MKIAIICVNHNSDSAMKVFVESVVAAAADISNLTVNMFVLNNAGKTSDLKPVHGATGSPNVRVQQFSRHNDGYFPTAWKFMQETGFDYGKYEYLVVSNVDLLVRDDFFRCLSCLEEENASVIGPAIIDLESGANRNPKMQSRPTFLKLLINYCLFLHPILYSLMKKLHLLKQRYVPSSVRGQKLHSYECYGVHGAFFIFRPSYFEHAELCYPGFLFGEELFVAEQCRLRNLRTVYCPNLYVHDLAGESTGKLKSSFYCKLNRMAIIHFLSERFRQ